MNFTGLSFWVFFWGELFFYTFPVVGLLKHVFVVTIFCLRLSVDNWRNSCVVGVYVFLSSSNANVFNFQKLLKLIAELWRVLARHSKTWMTYDLWLDVIWIFSACVFSVFFCEKGALVDLSLKLLFFCQTSLFCNRAKYEWKILEHNAEQQSYFRQECWQFFLRCSQSLYVAFCQNPDRLLAFFS